MSKKSKADLGPLDFMIDLAGAAAMKSITKNMILRDYKRGQGKEAITAATVVFTHQAMRKGSDGMVGLGGLRGINSAVEEINRQKAAEAAARRARIYSATEGNVLSEIEAAASDASFSPNPHDSVAKGNNNSEAWRLNTEEGKSYGLDPNDFATREDYQSALQELRDFKASFEDDATPATSEREATPQGNDVHTFCRVSLLSNGDNNYYLADGFDLNIGQIVKVQAGDDTAVGIVLTVEQHTEATAPVRVEEAARVMEVGE